MPSDLNRFVTAARTEDLLRAARAFDGIYLSRGRRRGIWQRVISCLTRRAEPGSDAVPLGAGITLRYAFPDDTPDLARLATLDSRPCFETPALVAEIEGEIRVALSLTDGAVIADPFHRTAGLISLLVATTRQEITPLRPRFQTRSVRPALDSNGDMI